MTAFVNSIPLGQEVRFLIRTKKTVRYVQVFEFVQFTGCYYALYICKKYIYYIIISKRLFIGYMDQAVM